MDRQEIIEEVVKFKGIAVDELLRRIRENDWPRASDGEGPMLGVQKFIVGDYEIDVLLDPTMPEDEVRIIDHKMFELLRERILRNERPNA